MLEKEILSNLVFNEAYARKVLPFLKPEYFHDYRDRWAYLAIHGYIEKYNVVPDLTALEIDINGRSDIKEKECRDTIDYIKTFSPDHQRNADWLTDKTEEFCQDKAIYNGIMASIEILQDKKGKKPRSLIPSILTDALAVSFDTNIGHDFLEDFEKRFEFYHKIEARTPFDLEMLNKITKNGLPGKTLNVILGGVGFGKTMFLCHFAANYLVQGKNVLYITLEMAEERIAERIDANLLDIELDMLTEIPKSVYDRKIAKVREKTVGKLIIKEFPTAGAHVGHFRHLLHELKIKKNFIPDVIMIDYLNICASSRVKMSGNINTYVYVKFIAEEIRGLAVETKATIWSATQVNREGFDSSDPGMTNTSESFGLPATVDFMGVIVETDDLNKLGQIMFKQLKNRFGDIRKNTRFVLGVDRNKQRLFDVEQRAQTNISAEPDTPVFDHGATATRFNKDLFKGFR
jgi:archaellum biogenesis ATPase FlaH